MPQPIQATVNWDTSTNGPVVSPNPIQVPTSNGATVIQWSAGSDVVGFQITGLDSTEFSYSNSTNPVTNFTATDNNNEVGTFTYSVTATHKTGLKGTHDPDIENGSELP
jgi:hypothetical protein